MSIKNEEQAMLEADASELSDILSRCSEFLCDSLDQRDQHRLNRLLARVTISNISDGGFTEEKLAEFLKGMTRLCGICLEDNPDAPPEVYALFGTYAADLCNYLPEEIVGLMRRGLERYDDNAKLMYLTGKAMVSAAGAACRQSEWRIAMQYADEGEAYMVCAAEMDPKFNGSGLKEDADEAMTFRIAALEALADSESMDWAERA